MDYIDINADLGEGFLFDEELLQLVSSCNVACGGHTGSEASMRATIQLAKKYGVTIGAHPSYPDKEGFGRRSLNILLDELRSSLSEQIKNLIEIAQQEGTEVKYVKPHGALYNEAMFNGTIALIIIDVVSAIDRNLALMGLPNSVLEKLCHEKDVKFIKEGFADRRYHNDGTLVSRSNSLGVIHRGTDVWTQVKRSLFKGKIESIEGVMIPLKIDSICFHGDTPEALEMLRYVAKKLRKKDIKVQSFI